jgi:hypothetical protein
MTAYPTSPLVHALSGHRTDEDDVGDAGYRTDALHLAEHLPKATRTPDGYLLVEGYAAVPGVLEYRTAPHRELVTREALEESAAAMVGVPFTLRHPPGGRVDSRNAKRYQVGSVVAAEVDDIGLRVRISVTDEASVKAVQKGIRGLSPGYRRDAVPPGGVHETHGPYDAVQRNRIPNHCAGVMSGRGGTTCRLRVDGDTHTGGSMDPDQLLQMLQALGLRTDSIEACRQSIVDTQTGEAQATARADAAEAQSQALAEALGVAPDATAAAVAARIDTLATRGAAELVQLRADAADLQVDIPEGMSTAAEIRSHIALSLGLPKDRADSADACGIWIEARKGAAPETAASRFKREAHSHTITQRADGAPTARLI